MKTNKITKTKTTQEREGGKCQHYICINYRLYKISPLKLKLTVRERLAFRMIICRIEKSLHPRIRPHQRC